MKKTVKQVDVRVAMELVSRLYEAAIDPAGGWEGFLGGFADAVQGGGASIWVQDYSDGKAQLEQASGAFAAHARWAPGYLESYGAYYSAKNVWAQNAYKYPVGSALTSEMLYPDRDMPATEYYSDWLRPQGLRYALGGPLHRKGTLDVHFSCLRAEQLGPFDASHQELHGLLMPHFKRALGFHLQLSRERAREVTIMAAFDSMQSPVWVLDHNGVVSFANAAGMAVDSAHDGLWIDRSGKPAAASPADNDALRRLIANSTRLAQGGSVEFVAAISVRRTRNPSPLYVNAYPVRNGLSAVAIALFITDPSKVPQSSADAVRALFGLTKAEASLAMAIGQGASVSEYGEAGGVSVNTLKTHLKRVLDKTGARNQAALVRLLSSMSWNTPRRP